MAEVSGTINLDKETWYAYVKLSAQSNNKQGPTLETAVRRSGLGDDAGAGAKISSELL